MRRSMRPERLQSLKSIERAHQLGRSGTGRPKVAPVNDGRTISLSKQRWCGSLLAGSVYLPKAMGGRPAAPTRDIQIRFSVSVAVERADTAACGVLEAAAVHVVDARRRRFFDVPRGAEGRRRAPAGGEGASHIGQKPDANDGEKDDARDDEAPSVHGQMVARTDARVAV